MVNMDKLLDTAIKRGTSDIHLICGIPAMFRIKRQLLPYEEGGVLTEEDMNVIYDYLVRGNIEKDNMYKTTRKLDSSYDFNGIRLRVNISMQDQIPLMTLRVIKNELPTFEELGVPDVVRRMMNQTQGLILVTGKTNSGKSTTLSALIDDVNKTVNKKILSLESPVEFKHKCKKSVIVQKEIGPGQDCLTYKDGIINCLREDCDIIIVGEIRDRETMDAAIDAAESGHLVIGTLHTKSCAETIDRIINFYDIPDQPTIKYMTASLLKLVTSQRLIRDKNQNLVLVPEVMVVDNIVRGCIRKEKFSVSESEDAIQSNSEGGSIGLVNSLAGLFNDDRITLEQAKAQIEEKNYDVLERTIMQLKVKKEGLGGGPAVGGADFGGPQTMMSGGNNANGGNIMGGNPQQMNGGGNGNPNGGLF